MPEASKIAFYNRSSSSSGSSSSGGGGGSSTVSGSKSVIPEGPVKVYQKPTESALAGNDGTWVHNALTNTWKYQKSDGSFVNTGWCYIKNPYAGSGQNSADWFYFDGNGIMQTGWIRSSDNIKLWWYCNKISDGTLGAMQKGWHHDTDDDKWYYLDVRTGIMWQGHCYINGHEFYFTRYEEVPHQTWYWAMEETWIGKWFYKLIGARSYGSMYANEITPDGYVAASNGTLTRPANVTAVTASTTGNIPLETEASAK